MTNGLYSWTLLFLRRVFGFPRSGAEFLNTGMQLQNSAGSDNLATVQKMPFG